MFFLFSSSSSSSSSFTPSSSSSSSAPSFSFYPPLVDQVQSLSVLGLVYIHARFVDARSPHPRIQVRKNTTLQIDQPITFFSLDSSSFFFFLNDTFLTYVYLSSRFSYFIQKTLPNYSPSNVFSGVFFFFLFSLYLPEMCVFFLYSLYIISNFALSKLSLTEPLQRLCIYTAFVFLHKSGN